MANYNETINPEPAVLPEAPKIEVDLVSKINALNNGPKQTWSAIDVSMFLGYGNLTDLPDKILGDWSDDFSEGQDYYIASLSDKDVQKYINDIVEHKNITVTNASFGVSIIDIIFSLNGAYKPVILFESGLTKVLSKSDKPRAVEYRVLKDMR